MIMKKARLHELTKERGSRMSDRLSGLPDAILCHILSFVTVRDSVRTRILSSRWRYLSDYRSVLHFDALNLLGFEIKTTNSYYSNQSKFIRSAYQFLETRRGCKYSALKVRFHLRNDQASHIDKLVESVLGVEIADLELDFMEGCNFDQIYVLSDELFNSCKTFHMKHLRLTFCALKLSSGCSSWMSHLATLELYWVRLDQTDIQRVLCGCSNLTSLLLFHSSRASPESIKVQLPRLKKLYLNDHSVGEVELNCPNLETLECVGRVRYFKFSHVPLLTEVDMSLDFHHQGGSFTFQSLARHAPRLQTLSLLVMTEVEPLPANITMWSLRRLELKAEVPIGFDLFTITTLLNSCPFLEILHVKLRQGSSPRRCVRRKYPDQTHFHLKEVIIDGFRALWNEMELAQYLLKNAVALQRMVIVDRSAYPWSQEEHDFYCFLFRREDIATILLQGIKTTAELVVIKPDFSNPLDFVNYRPRM